MNMIFGLFSETDVRLLKNIILQLFSKYSKHHNTLNVKSPLTFNSTTFNKNMARVKDVKLHVSNRTIQELFRIALIKPVAFVVFEILCNNFSMQIFLNANNY